MLLLRLLKTFAVIIKAEPHLLPFKYTEKAFFCFERPYRKSRIKFLVLLFGRCGFGHGQGGAIWADVALTACRYSQVIWSLDMLRFPDYYSRQLLQSTLPFLERTLGPRFSRQLRCWHYHLPSKIWFHVKRLIQLLTVHKTHKVDLFWWGWLLRPPLEEGLSDGFFDFLGDNGEVLEFAI